MLPRSYIEAMDRPTVLYIIYTMVSAQQTNLLPKNASRNGTIFAQKVYQIYATTSQYLSSYGCTITMVYIYILYIYICTTYVRIHKLHITYDMYYTCACKIVLLNVMQHTYVHTNIHACQLLKATYIPL